MERTSKLPRLCVFLGIPIFGVVGSTCLNTVGADYYAWSVGSFCILFFLGVAGFAILEADRFLESHTNLSVSSLKVLRFLRVDHGRAFWSACMNGELLFLRNCLIAGFSADDTILKLDVVGPVMDRERFQEVEFKDRCKAKALIGAVTTVLVGERVGILPPEIWLKIATDVKKDLRCWKADPDRCIKLLLGVRAKKISDEDVAYLRLDGLRHFLDSSSTLLRLWQDEKLARIEGHFERLKRISRKGYA